MTEAQRLARELTAIKRRAGDVIDSDDSDALHKAAAELRRLDEVKGDYQRLLEKHNNLHKNYTAMLAVSEARAAECEQLRKYKELLLDALWKASGDDMEAVSGYLESVGLSLDAMKKTK